MKTTLTLLAALLAVGVLQARVRELEPRALHEGETAYLTVPGAERARVSNAVVLSAVCREGGEAELAGLRLGSSTVTFFDAAGPAATLRVDVRPAYWEMLGSLFADNPEIRAEVAGDRVILTGSTADVGALRRVREAQALDPERIVSHVSVSPEALKALLDAFLRRNGQEGIAAELVGQEVCLFLSYDSTLARNLGVEISDSIGADFDLTYTLHDNLSGTIGNSDGLSARINTLKQNEVAKQLYATTLSTQSGEPAEFQSGGTLYKETSDLYKTGITEIEYGYIIKARPTILDGDTVNLEFDLDLRTPINDSSTGDTDVSRYQTKSKYIVRPGESILLSGFNHWTEGGSKRGLPFFSRIPLIGGLFGSEGQDPHEPSRPLSRRQTHRHPQALRQARRVLLPRQRPGLRRRRRGRRLRPGRPPTPPDPGRQPLVGRGTHRRRLPRIRRPPRRQAPHRRPRRPLRPRLRL